jgi:predicted TPR repeat methyltransferase
LGIVLGIVGQTDEAIAAWRQAIAIQGDYFDAHLHLAHTLRTEGQLAEAAACYREALRIRPDHEECRYFLAILEGTETPKTAPASFIEHLFNTYARTFDEHLVTKLEYRSPELLRAALERHLPAGPALDILDLGCGTGLCGLKFKDLARTLTGVDLSAAMLRLAKQRGIYDHLEQGDLTQVMLKSEARYDLLLAADVFIYVGNLTAAFEAARRVLRPGGRLAFSLEATDEADYVARLSGRFAHSVAYIRRLAAEHGYKELAFEQVVFRKETNQDVPGFIFVLAVES